MNDARAKLKLNQRRVLAAWERLSGDGSFPTTREIAKEAGMNINGVAQMLNECADVLMLAPCEPLVQGDRKSRQKWRPAV